MERKLRDRYLGTRGAISAEVERMEWDMRKGVPLPCADVRRFVGMVERFVKGANEVFEKARRL